MYYKKTNYFNKILQNLNYLKTFQSNLYLKLIFKRLDYISSYFLQQ